METNLKVFEFCFPVDNFIRIPAVDADQHAVVFRTAIVEDSDQLVGDAVCERLRTRFPRLVRFAVVYDGQPIVQLRLLPCTGFRPDPNAAVSVSIRRGILFPYRRRRWKRAREERSSPKTFSSGGRH